MPNNEKLTPEEKLNAAIEKFDILKESLDDFSIYEQLTMASNIRNNVVADRSITEGCENSQALSDNRKLLLEKITEFQKVTISEVTKDKYFIDCSENVTIEDFIEANESLFGISRDELSGSLNSEGDTLYSKIEESYKHKVTLKNIVDRGTKNEYKILLMGEYQSGKTTLVDSVIGRHISAIGDGNTTSAIPIAFSYGTEVRVVAQWKNIEHLRLLLSYIKKYIKDFSVKDFDINNKNKREELYQKLEDFRCTSDCPKAKEPGLKILAICSLILKYYNDYRLKNVTQGGLSISTIPVISRFPVKFETRWHKKGGDDFKFEESIFAFLERVQCFLPSDTLKQLNCTIIDSPGLFSNAYDTKVTEREMVNANAVLYLLPYDKEVGEDTCGSLYILRNNYADILRKLFIVNNRSFCDHKRFFQTNRETIDEMFGPTMDLYKLDARLAYLGVIKKSYDAALLSNEEILQFINSCQHEFEDDNDSVVFNNFLDAWNYSISFYKSRFRWENAPTAQEIIEKSNLLSVLTNLLTFIDKNRAYSIIASEGIYKLYNEISSIRKSLSLRHVRLYLDGREKTELLWNVRLSRAKEFEQIAHDVIQKHLFGVVEDVQPLSERLSESVYLKIFTDDSINNLVVNICREVYNNKWDLTKCGKNEEKIKKLIAPKIESVVANFIIERVDYWNELMKNGQDSSFNSLFKAQIKLLESELDTKWKETFDSNDDNEFDSTRNLYFEVKKDTSRFTIGNSQNNGNGFSTGRVSLMGSLLNDVAMIVAAILLFLIPTIISIILAVVSNPAGWVAGAVAGGFGAGYYLFTGDDWMEKKFVDSNAQKIKEKLSSNNLNAKLQNFLQTEIRKILKAYASTLTLNVKRLDDDRDVSLSSPIEEVEHNCFVSVKEIIAIDEIIKIYVEFVNRYIRYAKN